MKTVRIMLIGASGVFGCRIAEQLAVEPSIHLTLVARDRSKLQKIAAHIAPAANCITLDRDKLTGEDLRDHDLVIDAAGPFQASTPNVINAAIAAGCHYIDLADGREFIASISSFDAGARAAGIAVISGASSIPALSHAVLDDLVRGWQQIDTIKIGIFPGNRAPRGRAVVEAILSYVGKPVRIFRDGLWQKLPGWGMTHRVQMPGIGKRWASICDTPEQDLLVARYKPKQSAEFFAGMELAVLHLGLASLAMLVRWGIFFSLRPAAGVLLWMAQLLLPFGSDKGAMDVQVRGINALGQNVSARWTLQADANRGPYVPTLAALILARKLRDEGGLPIGAAPCSGMIALAEFARDFERLGIVTQTQIGPGTNCS
jgi:hypothetical protein